MLPLTGATRKLYINGRNVVAACLPAGGSADGSAGGSAAGFL